MREEGTSENLTPSLAKDLIESILFCAEYPEYPNLSY